MNNYENLIDTLLDGRYKLSGIVGIGGMAVVYEADDIMMNRKVAVKMLKDEIKEDIQEVKRFINESKAVAMLSHPNIVHIYDVSVKDTENHYIVMEYIDGLTLKGYITRKGRLNWHESISYTEQILNALAHAHDKGIIHRDIKPQNIILLRNGNIKIMDFGIAKIPNSEPLTMTDKAIGTVHYISPEQASGASRITNMSDIYSVGVLMYEMTTGKLPFNGNTPIQIAMMQVNEMPQDPRVINPEIPKGLAQIILKAMRKVPDDRYRSAGEMIQQLGILSANPATVFSESGKKSNGTDTPVKQQQKNLPVAVDVKKNGNGRNAGITKDRRKLPDKARQTKSAVANTDDGEDMYTNRGNARKKNVPVRRRRNRSMLPIISGVTLAFLIVLGVSGFNILLTLFGSAEDTGDTVTIPNYVGKPYGENLKADAQAKRLRVIPEYVYNDKYPPNTVIQQIPEGDEIKKLMSSNDRIDLNLKISKGKDSYELPDLSVLESREVKILLESKNIKVNTAYEPHDTILSGYVIRTEPSEGNIVNSGDTVTLYVSEGQDVKMTLMPDLIGKSEKEAKRILTEHNIYIKEIKSEYSNTVAPGYVIDQDIIHTRSVPEKSTKVTFTVSLGPKRY